MSAGIFAGVLATHEFALGLSQLGTDSSNPFASSDEFAANLLLPRLRAVCRWRPRTHSAVVDRHPRLQRMWHNAAAADSDTDFAGWCGNGTGEGNSAEIRTSCVTAPAPCRPGADWRTQPSTARGLAAR